MVDSRFPYWDVDVEEGKIYSLRLKRYIGSIDKKNGYVLVTKQKGYKHKGLHQYIWMVANGCDIPEGYDVHHIDHNPLNNSIYNLELIEQHKHRSEHNKGKIFSEETRKKLSEVHKGFKHSKESKEKMSKSKIGVYNNPKQSKQVAQYTLEYELVKIWLSANECERNGFNKGNISRCCNGELKTHKGFIWKYI